MSTTTSIKISRPVNCFMVFRLEKYPQIQSKAPKMNHRDISKVVAKWWKEMPDYEKEPYRIKAAQAKVEHAKMYPNYKYKPLKKSERNVRRYCRKEDLETRRRKVKEAELRVKPWLEVDARSACSPATSLPDLDSLIPFPSAPSFSNVTFRSSPELSLTPSTFNLENDFDLFHFSPLNDMTLSTQSWIDSNTAFYSQPSTPLDVDILSKDYEFFFMNATTDFFSQCAMMDSPSFDGQSSVDNLQEFLML